MDIEAIRQFCLALPATTEKIQWGADLVFKVGGKMYAAVVLDGGKVGWLSFKSTPEGFAELIEREGVTPAAYAARYHWVTASAPHTLRDDELRARLRDAYGIVRAALPKKVQAQLPVLQPEKSPKKGRRK
jgi:predicted DNA-binding protein (MmcQ/YjbR family)